MEEIKRQIREDVIPTVHRVEKAAQHTEENSTKTNKLLRVLLFACGILVVICIGLAIQVQSRNRTITKVEDAVATTRTSVRHLEAFVDRLEEDQNSDNSQAQNEAITRAVNIVPHTQEQVEQIKSILCQQFPNAEACANG